MKYKHAIRTVLGAAAFAIPLMSGMAFAEGEVPELQLDSTYHPIEYVDFPAAIVQLTQQGWTIVDWSSWAVVTPSTAGGIFASIGQYIVVLRHADTKAYAICHLYGAPASGFDSSPEFEYICQT